MDDLSKTYRWVLVVNVKFSGYQGGDGSRYILGQFDGNKFVKDHDEDLKKPRFLDYG